MIRSSQEEGITISAFWESPAIQVFIETL